MTSRIGIGLGLGVPAVLTLVLVAMPARAGTEDPGTDRPNVLFERVRVAAILARVHPWHDGAGNHHRRRALRFRGRARAEGNGECLEVRFGELHSRRPRGGVATVRLSGPFKFNRHLGAYTGLASARIQVGDRVEELRLKVVARITHYDHRPDDGTLRHGQRLRLTGRFHSIGPEVDPSAAEDRARDLPVTVFRGVFRGGGRPIRDTTAGDG